MQAKKKNEMNVDKAVMAMAGTFILISVLLGVIWTPWALAFTAFVEQTCYKQPLQDSVQLL